MRASADIAIVGGGIIGLTTAYFLAREGCSVILMDKGDFGHEASWAGAGILPFVDAATASSPMERLQAVSAGMMPTLSVELKELTGIDNGYRRCGGFEFGDQWNENGRSEWHAPGPHSQRMTEHDLRVMEPHIGPGLGPSLHLPDMAQLRNPRHLRALHAACLTSGVRLRSNCFVKSFEKNDAKIKALVTQDGQVHAQSFLIAAGAWADNLLTAVSPMRGIRPIRGQIVLLYAPAVPLNHILLCGPRYVVPRGDGCVLVGSTEEDVGFDKRNTAVAVQELLSFACNLVPALRQATMERCWSGLRPGTPDGLPHLGRLPQWENLFIAAGHFRSGILLSPVTARLMTELILGRAATVSLHAFDPGRTPAA